jgi:hypothetical protein
MALAFWNGRLQPGTTGERMNTAHTDMIQDCQRLLVLKMRRNKSTLPATHLTVQCYPIRVLIPCNILHPASLPHHNASRGNLPHKSLHQTRLLHPRKPTIQEHIPRHGIDDQEPSSLDPKPIIILFPSPGFQSLNQTSPLCLFGSR